MSEKRILTVGLELASSDSEYESFRSKSSLLDWDIILIKPTIYEFISAYVDHYQGKPALNDSNSFQLKECCEHWRREIKQAVETGKTVLVFLPALYEVYVDSGQRSYSGTGRNQRVTRHVEPYSNYEAIPATLKPVSSTGTSMKLAPMAADILAPYWAEFEACSKYQVVLTEAAVPACLVTKTGDKPVGAIYRSKASLGTLLLLPDIDFHADEFFKEVEKEEDSKAEGDDDEDDDEDEGDHEWTPEANRFAARMIASVVALDRALRATSEVTPEPAWAMQPIFALGPEAELRLQLLEAENRVEQAQRSKEQIVEALSTAGAYRRLLYEKGKALEAVIIDALRLLGFKAAPFRDSDSEFDVVFESEEGRLIGEAEGKDNRAVNIDKLRQLAMNIHEDLQRDEVKAPAKPVLFGNGFRLLPLEERSDPFTEKCHRAATTSSTALVFTPDLFAPVQYLLSQADSRFARSCREAILNSVGRVTFPETPTATTSHEIQVDSKS